MTTRLRALGGLLLACLVSAALAGCNTLEGAGEDLEGAGEGIQDAAD